MNKTEDKDSLIDPLGRFLRANAPQPPPADPELLRQLEWRIRGASRFGTRVKQYVAVALAASVAVVALLPEPEKMVMVNKAPGHELERAPLSEGETELFDQDLTLTLQIGSEYLRLVNSEDE